MQCSDIVCSAGLDVFLEYDVFCTPTSCQGIHRVTAQTDAERTSVTDCSLATESPVTVDHWHDSKKKQLSGDDPLPPAPCCLQF